MYAHMPDRVTPMIMHSRSTERNDPTANKQPSNQSKQVSAFTHSPVPPILSPCAALRTFCHTLGPCRIVPSARAPSISHAEASTSDSIVSRPRNCRLPETLLPRPHLCRSSFCMPYNISMAQEVHLQALQTGSSGHRVAYGIPRLGAKSSCGTAQRSKLRTRLRSFPPARPGSPAQLPPPALI